MPSSAKRRSKAVPMTAVAAGPSTCVPHAEPRKVLTLYSGFVMAAAAEPALLPSSAKCSVSALLEPSNRSMMVRPALPGAAEASQLTHAESVRAA